MYCMNCGNALPENALFCNKCGAKVGQPPESISAASLQPPPIPLELPPLKEPPPKGYPYVHEGIMEFGSMLGRIVNTYVNNFSKIFSISLVLHLAFYMGLGLIVVTPSVSFTPGKGGSLGSEFPFGAVFSIVLIVAFAIIFWFFNIVYLQGMIARIVAGYLVEQPQSIGDAYNGIKPTVMSLVLASILVMVITLLGLVCCILPGIAAAIYLSLTVSAIVLERKGASDGLTRSKDLVSGHWWYLFLLAICVGVAAAILGGILNVIFRLFAYLMGASSIFTVTNKTAVSAGQMFFSYFIQSIIQALITPVGAIMATVFYLDKRAMLNRGYVDIDLT